MPTARTATLVVASLLIYFFANQTQVGWLYVMSALLAGVVLAAAWMNALQVRGLQAERSLSARSAHGRDHDLYEGDALTIRLTLRNSRLSSSFQVTAREVCPLAPAGEQQVPLFAPRVPAGGSVQMEYEVVCDRRGLHTFPPLQLGSRAPFGFFRRSRTLPIFTKVLVYPELRPLARLDLLDRRPVPEVSRRRPGIGSEVIGVRPYRPGDSRRHIHWRTVARTRLLAAKEFADESRAGLTIVLDLHHEGARLGTGKHTTLEWALKIAASLAHYGYERGYPVQVAAACERWPVPPGPLSRFAVLQYLARVQAQGDTRIAEVLAGLRDVTFVAAILPWPDPDVVTPLVTLQNHGLGVMTVVLDPATFPGSEAGPTETGAAPRLAQQLLSMAIDARLVGWGDAWDELLAVPSV